MSYFTTSTQIAPGQLEATDTSQPPRTPCPICGKTQPHVSIQKCETGEWHITLCGHFEFTWQVSAPGALRLLLLFLRNLRTASSMVARPFLRQEWLAPIHCTGCDVSGLATCFGLYQEHISRWEKYWREGHWHALLSAHLPLLLTAELRAKVLAAWVPHFWLSVPQMQERLAAQGTTLSRELIEQAAQESGFAPIHYNNCKYRGFAQVRRLLRQLAPFKDSGFPLSQDWLVKRLFALNDELHERLQQGEALPTQTIVEVQTLRQLAGPAGQPRPTPARKAGNLFLCRLPEWTPDLPVC